MDPRLEPAALVRWGTRLFEVISIDVENRTVELENCATDFRITLPVTDVVGPDWLLVRSAA